MNGRRAPSPSRDLRRRGRSPDPGAAAPAGTPAPLAANPGIDELLDRMRSRDPGAGDALFAALYDVLRHYARVVMEHQSPGHTLTPTALVNEAYLRMAGRALDVNDRTHYVRVAARAMRQVLVDHARKRRRRKRGQPGQRRLSPSVLVAFDDEQVDVLALDDALERLAALDELSARVVELRYFGGLSLPEVAGLLDVPLRTVERHWSFARTWLHAELS